MEARQSTCCKGQRNCHNRAHVLFWNRATVGSRCLDLVTAPPPNRHPHCSRTHADAWLRKRYWPCDARLLLQTRNCINIRKILTVDGQYFAPPKRPRAKPHTADEAPRCARNLPPSGFNIDLNGRFGCDASEATGPHKKKSATFGRAFLNIELGETEGRRRGGRAMARAKPGAVRWVCGGKTS